MPRQNTLATLAFTTVAPAAKPQSERKRAEKPADVADVKVGLPVIVGGDIGVLTPERAGKLDVEPGFTYLRVPTTAFMGIVHAKRDDVKPGTDRHGQAYDGYAKMAGMTKYQPMPAFKADGETREVAANVVAEVHFKYS